MTRAQSLLAEIAPKKPHEVDMSGHAIRNATGRIKDALGRAARAADELASHAEEAAGNFAGTAKQAIDVVKDVAAADAEMREAFGLGGNGGPPLNPTERPSPQQSSGSTASEQGFAAVNDALAGPKIEVTAASADKSDGPQFMSERTPIGNIVRRVD